MRTYTKILFCLVFSTFFSIEIQANSWRDIVPLHTTCSDIESMFKIEACSSSESRIRYQTDTEFVDIFISKKPNQYQRKFQLRCDVPVGTVLEVIVSYSRLIPAKEFPDDFSKFEKTGNSPAISYSDEEKGLEFFLMYESVRATFLYPTKKDKELYCTQEKPEK